MKLKLHREVESRKPAEKRGETEQASLRFPVRAVREMPAPYSLRAGVIRNEGREGSARGSGELDAMRHPEMIRQIEATLDRMQASIDGLSEQVDNFKFPGVRDGERPRAA